ncbi:MAG: class I SAM-dependent methyltransferase [Candidatus Wallbacteria bacterium]
MNNVGEIKQCNFHHFTGAGKRGPSSFNMHDHEIVFTELNLRDRETFLDIGCGPGDYSIYASNFISEYGIIYAVDHSEEMLKMLNEKIKCENIKNIKVLKSDIYKQINLEDKIADFILISTVLHAKGLAKAKENLFKEIYRTLKTEGRLFIIECKKEERNFGPPFEYRVSPEELNGALIECKFKNVGYIDLGYNYMSKFIKNIKDDNGNN